jgi:hypothetical protein
MENEVIDMMKPYIEEQMMQYKDIDSKPFLMAFDDKTKEVNFKKIISGKMADEAIKHVKEYDSWREKRYKELMLKQDEMQKFISKINTKLKKDLTIPELFAYVEDNKPEGITTNDLAKIYVTKKDFEDIEKLKELDINIFKLLIDTKQLTTDEQEIMNKEDFWNEQDTVKIKIVVSFFRAKIAI